MKEPRPRTIEAIADELLVDVLDWLNIEKLPRGYKTVRSAWPGLVVILEEALVEARRR